MLEMYTLIDRLPSSEKYSLVDQIKRAAYSVPANIVEGHSRSSKKEFQRYLYIARASLEELRYFLLLTKDLKYINAGAFDLYMDKITDISKMLNGLIKSVN